MCRFFTKPGCRRAQAVPVPGFAGARLRRAFSPPPGFAGRKKKLHQHRKKALGGSSTVVVELLSAITDELLSRTPIRTRPLKAFKSKARAHFQKIRVASSTKCQNLYDGLLNNTISHLSLIQSRWIGVKSIEHMSSVLSHHLPRDLGRESRFKQRLYERSPWFYMRKTDAKGEPLGKMGSWRFLLAHAVRETGTANQLMVTEYK